MTRPLLLPALTAIALVLGVLPAAAKTDPAATLTEDDADSPSTPDKIREKLSADGYKDITVLPTSYVVSATDKDGKPVLLLIGPASATTLQEPPSTAENPPAKNQVSDPAGWPPSGPAAARRLAAPAGRCAWLRRAAGSHLAASTTRTRPRQASRRSPKRKRLCSCDANVAAQTRVPAAFSPSYDLRRVLRKLTPPGSRRGGVRLFGKNQWPTWQ